TKRAPLAPFVISRDCRGLRSESALRSGLRRAAWRETIWRCTGICSARPLFAHELPQSRADGSFPLALGRVSGIASPAAARPRSPNPAIIRKAVGLSKRSLTYPASVVLIEAPTPTAQPTAPCARLK